MQPQKPTFFANWPSLQAADATGDEAVAINEPALHHYDEI